MFHDAFLFIVTLTSSAIQVHDAAHPVRWSVDGPLELSLLEAARWERGVIYFS